MGVTGFPEVKVWVSREEDWGKVVPVKLQEQARQHIDRLTEVGKDQVIQKKRWVSAFNRFAKKHKLKQIIKTVSDLRKTLDWGGTNARNVYYKVARSVDGPHVGRKAFERDLTQIWNELKSLRDELESNLQRRTDIVYQVNGIPPTELLLVNLSGVVPTHELLQPTARNKLKKVKARGFARNALTQQMFVGDFVNENSADTTPYSKDHFKVVLRIVGVLLRDFGNSKLLGPDRTNDPTTSDVWPVILKTEKEKPQEFHRDYTRDELFGISGKRERCVKGERSIENERDELRNWDQKSDPFPWSADIPLAETGMRLNIWHGFQTNAERGKNGLPSENYNVTIEVPLGWMLLWRGDIIHGGGLENRAKNGAMRVHWYIPMKNVDKATIENKYTDKGQLSADVDRGYGSRSRMSKFLYLYNPKEWS